MASLRLSTPYWDGSRGEQTCAGLCKVGVAKNAETASTAESARTRRALLPKAKPILKAAVD